MKELLFLILLVFFASCQEVSTTSVLELASAEEDELLFEMASTYLFPLPENAFDDEHPKNEAIVLLGKELFHEKNLSLDRSTSCNTCHPLDDFGANHTPFSMGVKKQKGDRNSPTVYNAALHLAQFWDGRAKDVEAQVEGPLLNPKEMGMPSKESVVARVKAIPKYKRFFEQAYNHTTINYKQIAQAIGAFERTLLTPSRLDVYLQGDFSALSSQEKKGLRTMLDIGCIPCHSGSALGGSLYQKFGIFGDYRNFTGSLGSDYGMLTQSEKETDRDVFKVPSLRNITKTAPYFHDGSVEQLEDAVQLMSKIQLGQELTEQQVNDIISFLEVSSDWL